MIGIQDQIWYLYETETQKLNADTDQSPVHEYCDCRPGRTSARFCFEMASIEFEKKKTAGKKIQNMLWLLSTMSLHVNFKVEAKVLR